MLSLRRFVLAFVSRSTRVRIPLPCYFHQANIELTSQPRTPRRHGSAPESIDNVSVHPQPPAPPHPPVGFSARSSRSASSSLGGSLSTDTIPSMRRVCIRIERQNGLYKDQAEEGCHLSMILSLVQHRPTENCHISWERCQPGQCLSTSARAWLQRHVLRKL